MAYPSRNLIYGYVIFVNFGLSLYTVIIYIESYYRQATITPYDVSVYEMSARIGHFLEIQIRASHSRKSVITARSRGEAKRILVFCPAKNVHAGLS